MSEDIELEVSHETILTSAILHILDYSSGNQTYSQTSLNLQDPFIEKYVLRYVGKIRRDMRNAHGYFKEDSQCLKYLEGYKHNAYGFVDLSVHLSELFNEYLKEVAVKSYDVLVMHYHNDDIPYLGIVLLEGQQGILHTTDVENGLLRNTLMVQNALMPPTSKKLNTFCQINLLSYEILFTDDTNWSNGTKVMQDLFLQCTSEKSSQEVIAKVTEIANDIAVTYDENPSMLLAKVKHAMKERVEQDVPLNVEEVVIDALETYPKQDEMIATYTKRVQEEELPKEVEVSPSSLNRKMRNQKLRTDTGIELSFPIEYFQNPDLIEFVNHEDGTISIEIKNVGKIINRG